MDDLLTYMKERRRADEKAAAIWAARTADITAWARKVVTLLRRRGIPADQTLFDRVGGEKTRRATGWLIHTVTTRSSHGGAGKEIGILLTPAAELWQYDAEWPLSVQLTAQRPNHRTDAGAVLLARCEFVLDHAVEAMADALDRHGITVAELESLH
ncbi:hypothetical protein [Nocardia sp. NRRL S-836]|uniref:hypothetical protein n=1 Tax=Nocardia sp. NRRL S-836 TaxID=1519492 RepID=UPI0006ADD9FC|nr:hypothetical protein [Nocardia sp. NRRL S-836]KOV86709.1 hypothetical protein ADL03_08345 [Nocardia sp. NRRL S-836]